MADNKSDSDVPRTRSSGEFGRILRNWLHGGRTKKPPAPCLSPPISEHSAQQSERNALSRAVISWRGTELPLFSQEQLSAATSHCDNHVRTTKYTALTFVPLNLFEQFHRVANVYFLFFVILQLFPTIRQINVFIAAIPLLLVLAISAFKDAVEDNIRRRLDRDFNSRKCLSLPAFQNWNERQNQKKPAGCCAAKKKTAEAVTVDGIGSAQMLTWSHLRVGDVVAISDGEPIPADVVVLYTSKDDGRCFVETREIDGESNLKVKEALLSLEHFQNSAGCSYRLECEPPNSDLYSFAGNLHIASSSESASAISVAIENVLLRGSTLQNTKYVIAMIAYTGHESKILVSSGKIHLKRSNIERKLNPMVILNVLILIVLCAVVAILRTIYSGNYNSSNAPYSFLTFSATFWKGDNPESGILTFLSCTLLLNSVVPISLYVMVEICRIAQAFFIYSDKELRDEAVGKGCDPRTWNISDDLGQIEYVFADKTGTLTKNSMRLRQFSVGSQVYGTFLDATEESTTRMLDQMRRIGVRPEQSQSLPSVIDNSLFLDLLRNSDQTERLLIFFYVLTLCHSAVYLEASSSYVSPSADEVALLEGSGGLGFKFCNRSKTQIKLSLLGESVNVDLLCTFEFTTERRRMSVVVRDASGRILLLCKGADSAIFERIVKNAPFESETIQNLHNFAKSGLRTMCIAYKELDPSFFNSWNKQYQEARLACSSDRAELVGKLIDELESDLQLIGSTAVQDELQDQVTETIEAIKQASINVWMLTGDKLETAISVGVSCRLIVPSMQLHRLDACDLSEVQSELAKIQQEIDSDLAQSHAFALTGESLNFCLKHRETYNRLLKVATRCSSVICARSTPTQKAAVVHAIRSYTASTVLAVGDGANDVRMIREANVGIGILGSDGVQASMASDYSLIQFHHLSKLLLVHGRWAYNRVSKTILAMFLKNLTIILPIFFFQFFCLYTASSLYCYLMLILFNVIFTFASTLVIGIFDSDIRADYCVKYPQLYQHQRSKRPSFNIYSYFQVVLLSLYVGGISFFVPYFTCSGKSAVISSYQFGMEIFTIVTFSVTILTAMYLKNWNWIAHCCVWGNLVVYIAFFLVYSVAAKGEAYWVFFQVFGDARFYFLLAVCCTLCCAPVIAIRYAVAQLHPTATDIIAEMQILKKAQQS